MRRDVADYESNALEELYKMKVQLNLTDEERNLINDYFAEKNKPEHIEIDQWKSINEVAREHGITRQTLWRRLKILKWSWEKAINTPVGAWRAKDE